MSSLFPQFRGCPLASADGWTASFVPVLRSENPLVISRPGQLWSYGNSNPDLLHAIQRQPVHRSM